MDVLKEEFNCTLFARYLYYLLAVLAVSWWLYVSISSCLYFLITRTTDTASPALAGAAVCVLQGLRRLIFCAIHPP